MMTFFLVYIQLCKLPCWKLEATNKNILWPARLSIWHFKYVNTFWAHFECFLAAQIIRHIFKTNKQKGIYTIHIYIKKSRSTQPIQANFNLTSHTVFVWKYRKIKISRLFLLTVCQNSTSHSFRQKKAFDRVETKKNIRETNELLPKKINKNYRYAGDEARREMTRAICCVNSKTFYIFYRFVRSFWNLNNSQPKSQQQQQQQQFRQITYIK